MVKLPETFYEGRSGQSRYRQAGKNIDSGVCKRCRGAKRDVAIIGVGNWIEIWNPKRLEENSTYDEDEIAGHMAELGI